jgi:hypothetical protein
MFYVKAFLFVVFLPAPFLGFWHQLVAFDSPLLGVFGRILSIGSLECPMLP